MVFELKKSPSGTESLVSGLVWRDDIVAVAAPIKQGLSAGPVNTRGFIRFSLFFVLAVPVLFLP